MKQINLMEHLTNVKNSESSNKQRTIENIDGSLIQNQELTNIVKRDICHTYLIPLLVEYYSDKIPLFSKFIDAIKDDKLYNQLNKNEYGIFKLEKSTIFIYQTCLNFVDEYYDLILSPKFTEETKKELIINSFVYSDFENNLLKANHGIEEFENGCYVSINLHEICKD